MSKITVKINIPAGSPDQITELSSSVNARHKELGDNSPLKSLDMNTFESKLLSAMEKRSEAKKMHDQAEILNQQANLELGIDKSQNSKTTGTVYSLLTSIRDILLGLNKGQEENLKAWGFDVVVGTASQAKKKENGTK